MIPADALNKQALRDDKEWSSNLEDKWWTNSHHNYKCHARPWIWAFFFLHKPSNRERISAMKLDNQKERDHMEDPDIDGRIIFVSYKEQCIDV